ncbi:MAG: P-type conjugative transfer protein TrbL [Desulfovibrionaceae bacterium]|nr:P-type conjugative transfer protein TrbL [Desulfovibrionaceae bacterium]
MSKKVHKMSFRLKKAFIWKNLLLFSGSFIMIYLFLVNTAFAEVDNSGIVADIYNEYKEKSQQWGDIIKKYALSLFYVLLILDVCIFGVRMVLQRPELPMILGQFAMMLITAGIFFAIINNWQEWSWQIIKGMTGISGELGISPTSVDAPFLLALDLVENYWKEASALAPIKTLGLAIATIVLVICLALITAQVLFIKCEALIAMTASIVLLGLSGSGMFKDYAVNTCRYALSVAFKLFVIYLLLGIGMSFINSFTISGTKFEDILTTLAACAVLLVLVKQLPDACAGIINGSHVSNSNALGSAVMAGVHVGAAAASGGASAVAAGAAGLSNVKAAASLAGMQGQGGIMGTARTLGSAMSRARESGQSVSNVLRSQHEAQRQNDSL